MSRIIYGFSDQGKFSVHNSWDRPTVIHHRELGIKYGNIYPEATWSDVTIKDVPLDITFQWEDEIEEIKLRSYLSFIDEVKDILINSRENAPKRILTNQVFFRKEIPGEGKLYSFRKRKGTKKTNNKYPTKPKKNYTICNRVVENYESFPGENKSL
jgi:hypothetical protein